MNRTLCSKARRWAIYVTVLGLLSMLAGRELCAADLSGYWQGRWRSCTTGHKGPLNASFCSLSDSCYRVEFTGRFFGVFPFRYSVKLNVVSDDGESVTLAGRSYLGRLFGTFRYSATASDQQFSASYRSRKDCGKFELCRVCRYRSHCVTAPLLTPPSPDVDAALPTESTMDAAAEAVIGETALSTDLNE